MIAGEHRLALPAGYQLGKYRFKEVLGAGGFGITYLAEDHSLGRRVAIKELLPNDIATRLDGSTVVAKSKSEEDNLAWARDRFMKEGKALAACEHPSVVHVYEMIEANGTAYMVTKYEDGRSLSVWIKEVDGSPTEKELRSILIPLLAGLEKVHKAGFLHRDLKPENIYITDDGRPLLLDFGSARQAVSDRTTSLTSIVTSGYAPFEQYHEDGKQGAWTDLYALAAVIYRAIHGKKPPEATRRLKDDPCLKLAREYSGKYSPQFLNAIDKALAVEGQKRPQSVPEWRTMLGDGPVEPELIAAPWWKRHLDVATQFAREKPAIAAGAGVGFVLLVTLVIWKLAQPSDDHHVVPPSNATPSPATPVLAAPVPATPIPGVDLQHQPATPVPVAVTPFPRKETVVDPPRTSGVQVGPRPGEAWENSLGQAYLPVPGAGVHMGATEVRRGDFEAFVRATGYNATVGTYSLSTKGWTLQGASWIKPSFAQTPAHPVVGVNVYDALEFCRWLTAKERTEGKIDQRLAYRLPTDEEWSKAVGNALFPWGSTWPPTIGAGNYAGQETSQLFDDDRILPNYNDGFVQTSPVGAFQPNASGFYDLGGNAFELCGTWYSLELNPPDVGKSADQPVDGERAVVMRGGSYIAGGRQAMMSRARYWCSLEKRYVTVGFRCVLAPAVEPPAFVLPPHTQSQEVAPVAPDDGRDPVDRKMVAIWEFKPTNAPQGTLRWEQQASGRYTVVQNGAVTETGVILARDGQITRQLDGTSQRIPGTYRFKTTTQLAISGALGEVTWRRIRALPTDTKPPAPKEETDNDEKRSNSGSTQGTKPRADDPSPRPKARPEKNVERTLKDLGNSIRRRLPF